MGLLQEKILYHPEPANHDFIVSYLGQNMLK